MSCPAGTTCLLNRSPCLLGHGRWGMPEAIADFIVGSTETVAKMTPLDVNNDGDTDLVLGFENAAPRVWMNPGTSPVAATDYTFATSASGWGSKSVKDIALADMNGDGAMDVLLATTSGFEIIINPCSADTNDDGVPDKFEDSDTGPRLRVEQEPSADIKAPSHSAHGRLPAACRCCATTARVKQSRRQRRELTSFRPAPWQRSCGLKRRARPSRSTCSLSQSRRSRAPT